MEKKNFITEQPQTLITKSHGQWMGETYVKVKGYCYMITTFKGSRGITSHATQVADEGNGSVSYCLGTAKEYNLGTEMAMATEAKVNQLHHAAIAKFLAMEDLPVKEEAYQIKPGQVTFLGGYGQDQSYHERNIIYKVTENEYFTVNETTLVLGRDNLNYLEPVNETQRIGQYYKENDVVDMEVVNALLAKAHEKIAKDEAERPAREAAAKAELDAAMAAIEAEYPYLEKPGKNNWGAKHVAINLRIELKRSFPGIKFSITSDNNSVNISWTDGPTKDQVSEYTRKYVDHFLDQTGDYMDCKPSLFNDVFGGCTHVFSRREISDETKAVFLAWAQQYVVENCDKSHSQRAIEVFRDCAIPTYGPWHIVREGNEWQVQPLAAEPTEPIEAGATENSMTVSRNEAKGGIEIKFDSKPDDEIIELLKMTGFRWSHFSKVWWAKYTDDLWQFANKLSTIMVY